MKTTTSLNPLHLAFTLIEVMVVLSIVSLLGIMAWRGVAGLETLKVRHLEFEEKTQLLQNSIHQWRIDLQDVYYFNKQMDLPQGALWNGQLFKLVRQGLNADQQWVLRVVGWTLRQNDGTLYWMRWQSPDIVDKINLQKFWSLVDDWSKSATQELRQYEVALLPLQSWQLYFRTESDAGWANALSSTQQNLNLTKPGLPQAVRLNITTDAKFTHQGTYIVDWLNPLSVKLRQ
ncbi:MAG: prepilin-type N-terminal cleavage/methylation domain-containing protein [Gammaproteobacteria bacterium]|nr:prepilin-type N-terminal cleavage/methylation domain-containing protein [Gammaproteobacteria bacterium]